MKTWFNRFLLVDFDTIEVWNLLNQTYLEEDVWSKKTDALAKQLVLNAPMPIIAEQAENIYDIIEWKVELEETDLIIISADNPTVRRDFIKWYKEKLEAWELYMSSLIMVGTSSESMWIYINQQDAENLWPVYELYNWDKSKYSVGLCGNKSAYFMGSLVSGLVISNLKNNVFPYPEDSVVISLLWHNETSTLHDLPIS